MKKTRLLLIIFVTALVTASATIAVDNYLGLRFGSRVLMPAGDLARYREDQERYAKLEYILALVGQEFYEETDEEILVEGAYKGVLEALEDPYSVYYTAEEYAYFNEVSTGTYGGIGVIVTAAEDGTITVVSPIEDTPGERAGLLSGDKILTVDGVEVFAETIDDAVARMKGEPGTPVVLGVFREGEEDLLEVEIIRAEIVLKAARSEVLEPDIGYLRLNMFDSKAYEEFKENLDDLRSRGVRGLVLDLRNNPGGNLDECVKIADELLGRQTVVTVDYRNGDHEVEVSDEATKLDLPLVILVNGGSASASEILTGAAQDSGSATVVGETTFGKGLVQVVEPFTDGSAVKLTVATYKTPAGRYIHGEGIEPDVAVGLPEGLYYGSGLSREDDTQLEKALEILGEAMDVSE